MFPISKPAEKIDDISCHSTKPTPVVTNTLMYKGLEFTSPSLKKSSTIANNKNNSAQCYDPNINDINNTTKLIDLVLQETKRQLLKYPLLINSPCKSAPSSQDSYRNQQQQFEDDMINNLINLNRDISSDNEVYTNLFNTGLLQTICKCIVCRDGQSSTEIDPKDPNNGWLPSCPFAGYFLDNIPIPKDTVNIINGGKSNETLENEVTNSFIIKNLQNVSNQSPVLPNNNINDVEELFYFTEEPYSDNIREDFNENNSSNTTKKPRRHRTLSNVMAGVISSHHFHSEKKKIASNKVETQVKTTEHSRQASAIQNFQLQQRKIYERKRKHYLTQ